MKCQQVFVLLSMAELYILLHLCRIVVFLLSNCRMVEWLNGGVDEVDETCFTFLVSKCCGAKRVLRIFEPIHF